MRNCFNSTITVCILAIFFLSCKHEPVPINTVCDQTAFTYSVDIKPIMDAHCTSCHTQGSGVSNGHVYLENWTKLNDYVTTDPDTFIGDITHTSGYNSMPKGTAQMSDCEIIKIKNWIGAGAPNN